MRISVIVPMISALILSGCMVAPRRGGGVEIIPILPVTVEIGDESYYEYEGYHYFYVNDGWQYSATRNGPRRELPRSHWPRETRHRRSQQYR